MSGPDAQSVEARWEATYGALTNPLVEVSYRPSEPTATDRAGEMSRTVPRVSGYVVETEVGGGGMGVVYAATQQALGRKVAIKVSSPHDPGGRFHDEACLVARLDHPNVLPVHDLVSTAEGDALVMKLVEGRRWRESLRARAPGAFPGEADLVAHLDVLLAVCNAISFAHSRGIAHCDVKPDNVMRGAYGEVYLVDWGLACELGAPADGVPSGTPRYMAPEQAAGEARTALTDVFLLGATLYEILMGTPPHPQASLGAVVRSAVVAAPPVLSEAVPEGLAALCRTAMAARPCDRHPDVAAFQAEIRRYLERRESARLTDAAARMLDQARSFEGTAAYVRLGDAVAAYQQARVSWPESPAARAGEAEALRRFAETALADGDLGLAEAQARRLPDEAVVRHDLLHRIAEMRRALVAREAAARTQRRLLIAAVAVIIVGLGVGMLVLAAERRRTEAQALLATARLADIQRLADVRRLDDLATRVDRLWPAVPQNVPALEAWLAEARDVAARLPGHRAWLERLEREHGRREGDAWRFQDARVQWEHDALRRMVDAGNALATSLIPRIETRLDAARTVEAETIGGPQAAAWARAIAEVARDPRFAGTVLHPQLGLVPLGRDPRTGLQEFAHRASGAVPRRGPDGSLVRSEETGVVLVLLPGGRFRMGASRTGPHPDPWAKAIEGPPREVRLAPFMLSKYEMTQAQWMRASDDNPSSFPVGRRVGGRSIGGLNPVEHVSWDEASETLRRLDLALPTEAQWEYAARGATTTPWASGATVASL